MGNTRLWNCLSSRLLEGSVELTLATMAFATRRIITFSKLEGSGWASFTDWQTLYSTLPQSVLKLEFLTPTTFRLPGTGKTRMFGLFLEPINVWGSLGRVWNTYAPEPFSFKKEAFRQFVERDVKVIDCSLSTTTWKYPDYPQKGFVGNCTYLAKGDEQWLTILTTLAKFAQFAGIGYKTTMGMGQSRLTNPPFNFST